MLHKIYGWGRVGWGGMITFLGLEHMVDATQHAKAGVGWGQVFSYRAKRTSFWIKFLNTTGKVFESNRQSFRIQPEKFPNPPGKVSEDKFPNPTGKVSESNRKVSESNRKSFRRQVSESNRKSFRIQPESFRIQPEKFPNPTGKVSEDKFPNPTGKVSESNRKSFRIHPEKFPNPPGKISEYKFPNRTGKVSEDNGLVTESQLPEYKSYRIQPEKFPNPTGKFPNPPRKVSESNRKVSEYKFPNPTRKVSEYNGDRVILLQRLILRMPWDWVPSRPASAHVRRVLNGLQQCSSWKIWSQEGQDRCCWAVTWDFSEFGLIWDFLLCLIPVLFCSMFSWSPAYVCRNFWGICYSLSIRLCLFTVQWVFVCYVEMFLYPTREGYKATSLSRAQLSVLVPNVRSGNLRYGSWSRWRQQRSRVSWFVQLWERLVRWELLSSVSCPCCCEGP